MGLSSTHCYVHVRAFKGLWLVFGIVCILEIFIFISFISTKYLCISSHDVRLGPICSTVKYFDLFGTNYSTVRKKRIQKVDRF